MNLPVISTHDHPSSSVDRESRLLEVEDLSVSFLVDGAWLAAVRSVDLHVDRGETVAIVGESGSGKSATVTSLLGLLPRNGRSNASRIVLNGVSLDPRSPEMNDVRGRDIGFVFQDPQSSLNPVLTIGRQMTEQMYRHYRRSRDEATDRAIDLLAKVGLPNPAGTMKRFPFEFSGGMRQRIALAIALSCSPSLLIADEPTTALDVTVQAQILDLLKNLQRELDIGIVFITHDLSVAALVADRIVVMYAGEVVETAFASELSSAPRHPYTKGLWRSMPRVDQPGIPRGIDGTPPDLESVPAGCSFAPRCDFVIKRPCSLEQELVETSVGHWARCCRWSDLLIPAMPSEVDPPFLGRPQSERPVVALDHVSVTYRAQRLGRRTIPVLAVDDVSLDVERGRSVGIVGESGSGKSTLAKAMVRVVTPSTGRVLISGQDVTNLPEKRIRPLRRRVQMVFQDPFSSLNPRRTVHDTLLEPLLIHGIATGVEAEERVSGALDAVGLRASHADRYPHEFSGGQRQRIAIARALMPQPDLIICDEPVSSLDVSIQAQILRLLDELRIERDIGYVFIAHDLAVVASITEHVVVMYAGTVVEQGETLSVLQGPQHPYTKGLVMSAPSVRLERPNEASSFDIRGEPPDPGAQLGGCKFASRCWLRRSLNDPAVCETHRPPLTDLGDRAVACHFADQVRTGNGF